MQFTLNGWRTSAATALVEKLPLQNFETALVLVEGYLSSVGGWASDNLGDPTGFGAPVSGETPEQAVEQIFEIQYSRIYNIEATANITVKFNYHANLAPGQTDSSVLAALEGAFQEFLSTQLENTALEFETTNDVTATITNNGLTTVAQRRDINTETTEVGVESNDPRSIALYKARTRYGLDELWNVYSVFTQPSDELVIFIRKYTSVTYTTLDNGDTTGYVLNLERDRYLLTSGLFVTN